MRWLAAVIAVSAAMVLAGCGGAGDEAGACSNADGALDQTAFVFVEAPSSGERVSSGFDVTGCSSTFEANVGWRLLARDGRELVSGFTQGGSTEPGPFEFSVAYSVPAREVGRLEVFEPPVTTEGFPPVRDVVPLVLEP